jgi:hypothetical protein
MKEGELLHLREKYVQKYNNLFPEGYLLSGDK